MLPYPTPPSGGGLYVIRLSDTHYYGCRTMTFQGRWAFHYRRLVEGKHHNAYAQSVFNQHKRFEPEVLSVLPPQDQKEAEQKWLDENFGKPGCVNLSCSSEGVPVGYKHSETTREKMRNRDYRDPDYRKRLSEAQIRRHLEGRGFTEETRRKISQGTRGKNRPDTSERNKNSAGWHHSEDSRKRISEAGKRPCLKETREKISQNHKQKGIKPPTGGMRGLLHSEESKEKISIALKEGMDLSPEGKQKRSEAIRRGWETRRNKKCSPSDSTPA